MLLFESVDFFFTFKIKKKFSQEHYQSVTRLISDQVPHSVSPDLGPNCLQRLGQEEKYVCYLLP